MIIRLNDCHTDVSGWCSLTPQRQHLRIQNNQRKIKPGTLNTYNISEGYCIIYQVILINDHESKKEANLLSSVDKLLRYLPQYVPQKRQIS